MNSEELTSKKQIVRGELHMCMVSLRTWRSDASGYGAAIGHGSPTAGEPPLAFCARALARRPTTLQMNASTSLHRSHHTVLVTEPG